MIKTNKLLDYKIKSAKLENDNLYVKIKNKGEINGPVSVSAIKNDSILITRWYDGFEGTSKLKFPKTDYDKLRIDATLDMPEIRRKNNTLKKKGLFKKVEPFRFQFIGSIENPDRTQLFFSPILAYNPYDKLMTGIALYNTVVPKKRFDYILAPMLSFGTFEPVGVANFRFNYYPENIFKHISIGTSAKRFYLFNTDKIVANYLRIAPELKLDFKKKSLRNISDQYISFKPIYVAETTEIKGENASTLVNENTYYNLKYNLENDRSQNPFSFEANTQYHQEFLKVSAELNYNVSFDDDKELSIRLFAGKFLINNSNNPFYNWRMDGQRPSAYGSYDYTYDYLLLGRSSGKGLHHNQAILNHGGFKIPTAVGQSNNWITALNLELDLPFAIPLALYADVGMHGSSFDGNNLLYDVGVTIKIAKNIAEVYFPVLYSNNIKKYIDANDIKYNELIRFTFNIEALDPFKKLTDFEF